MPFRSEKQRRYLWANEPKIAREWTEEYGSKPVKAKAGKYQDLKHPEHDIKPVEHMEDKVSSKERVEKLLEDRKTKKDTKKKLAKDGPHYVPGWKPNLSVKAAEGELVRQPTRGTGAAVKGTEHYTMKGMPTAYQGQLIQTPTRGTGAAVKGTDHYIMPGMDAAKTGKLIKAKKGIWSGAASDMSHKPKGWDVKKISDKTGKKLTKVWKHRETGGWSPAAGKQYNKYLKSLKKVTTKTLPPSNLSAATKAGTSAKVLAKMSKVVGTFPLVNKLVPKKHRMDTSKFLKRRKALSAFPAVKSKSFHFKDAAKPSDFLHRRMTLAGGANPAKALSVLKKVGRRTGIGKAVAAATVVAGAYEAGKRKLFTKDKKKIDKKSIGGETVVMKSNGGYIDDLL